MYMSQCDREIGCGEPDPEVWDSFRRGEVDFRSSIIRLLGTSIFCHYCAAYLFKSLEDIRRHFDPKRHKLTQLYQHHKKEK
ncbi:MAG: hypothetical protein RMM98_18130 [Acidobacteriota bacterium]|nr:hypothetical protein [Blastocatellia bacterium]MDW8241524.1 hypothetical protein [Acidobacteriota bacterium]